jgi:hypothetical protein
VHPDFTFSRLEREFPLVRDKLIASRFENWVDDIEFLLSYMNMIRARSPLFLAQKEAENRALRGWTVKSVGPGAEQGDVGVDGSQAHVRNMGSELHSCSNDGGTQEGASLGQEFSLVFAVHGICGGSCYHSRSSFRLRWATK